MEETYSFIKDVSIIKKFWDLEVCNFIIEKTEGSNLFPKEETILKQETLDENLDSRDNFKVYLENEELGNFIFDQIQPFINTLRVGNLQPSGIHPQIRVYKYIEGQEFKRHIDGSQFVSEKEKSYYSLLIYLNNEFDGGYTTFDDGFVIPEVGMAVYFPHKMFHSGSRLEKGTKYVLRANILFK
jgi:prolyl 4-hydroxylase